MTNKRQSNAHHHKRNADGLQENSFYRFPVVRRPL
jgi:hypothetical protein